MSYELARLMNDPLLKPYVPVNLDAEGFCETKIPGFKHYAVRDDGRDSTYKPKVSNIAPRDNSWTPPAPAALNKEKKK